MSASAIRFSLGRPVRSASAWWRSQVRSSIRPCVGNAQCRGGYNSSSGRSASRTPDRVTSTRLHRTAECTAKAGGVCPGIPAPQARSVDHAESGLYCPRNRGPLADPAQQVRRIQRAGLWKRTTNSLPTPRFRSAPAAPESGRDPRGSNGQILRPRYFRDCGQHEGGIQHEAASSNSPTKVWTSQARSSIHCKQSQPDSLR